MMKTLRRSVTDNSRCSDLVRAVLALLLLSAVPLSVRGQASVWSLPSYKETVTAGSVALGSMTARDTYLSASTYNGPLLGMETDSWTGYKPYGFLNYGRTHSYISVGALTNSLGGGSTLSMLGSVNWSGMWHAVATGNCDLLLGPAGMTELGFLYNQQNSNNPVNVIGHIGAGICVDNTFRFALFRHHMAIQATFYMPLAGVGFAPDYDQPYWFMYRYGEAGKAIHFVCPFNNPALTQQAALILPIRRDRLRVGYTFDYVGNRLGGHKRNVAASYFTIGYVKRFETKEWGRLK